jgi:hypothetical protein
MTAPSARSGPNRRPRLHSQIARSAQGRVRHTASQIAQDLRPRNRKGQPRPLGLRRHLSRGRAFRSRTRRAHAERALNRAACAPPQGAEDDVERDGQCELGPGRRPRTLLLRRLKELDLQQPRIDRQLLPPRALPCRVPALHQGRGPSREPNFLLGRNRRLAAIPASCASKTPMLRNARP